MSSDVPPDDSRTRITLASLNGAEKTFAALTLLTWSCSKPKASHYDAADAIAFVLIHAMKRNLDLASPAGSTRRRPSPTDTQFLTLQSLCCMQTAPLQETCTLHSSYAMC